MNKKFLAFFVFTLVAVVILSGCTASFDFSIPESTTIVSNENIKVTSPLPNEVALSPLKVSGEAKGTWFFEGSFPIFLKDSDGNILTKSFVQTGDEWMTENFVQFNGEIKFSDPKTEMGTLILHKNNPSGLSKNDDSIEIPVRFWAVETAETNETSAITPSDEYMEILVFMGNNKLDPDSTYCEKAYPVKRAIPKTKTVANAAVTELLRGISMQEEDQGYFTSINSGVKIQKLTIKDGAAYIDFNQALQDKVGGSCLTARIRAQITETLKQFDSIDNVVISINGDSKTSLQP